MQSPSGSTSPRSLFAAQGSFSPTSNLGFGSQFPQPMPGSVRSPPMGSGFLPQPEPEQVAIWSPGGSPRAMNTQVFSPPPGQALITTTTFPQLSAGPSFGAGLWTTETSFVQELPLPVELQGRGYCTTYSLVQRGDGTSQAIFGVSDESESVLFTIKGGVRPKDSQVYIVYKGELDHDEKRDGGMNIGFVYDDFEVFRRQAMEGMHDRLFYPALRSLYQKQQGLAAADLFTQSVNRNVGKLEPSSREYAINSLAQTMQLGFADAPGSLEDVVLLTRVTLP